MQKCEYCGQYHNDSHPKYYYMCNDCGVLYGRYADLRSALKKASVSQANKIETRLLAIVDIYRARMDAGLKVPKSLQEYVGDGTQRQQVIGVCNYCAGRDKPAHGKHKRMCKDCGQLYDRYTRARSVLKACEAEYKRRYEAGCEIPPLLRKEFKKDENN